MEDSTTSLGGDLLLRTQLELISPTSVAGALYGGIAFTLFWLYVHSLVPRLRGDDRKGQTKFMLGYSAVILLCGLYNLVANAWLIQDACIKHADYPGGPYSYAITTFPTPATAVIVICQTLIDILTSAIQIWRVWVVWSATRYANVIILLPSMCFLTFTVLALRTVILEITLPFTEVVQRVAKTEVAGHAIQGATTILCTTLISLFLLFEQRRQRKIIGKTQGSAGYMKIVTMLIDSYGLESIWLLIEAASLDHPVAAFFSETQPYIEIIAYLLVQYRVASGQAYASRRE